MFRSTNNNTPEENENTPEENEVSPRSDEFEKIEISISQLSEFSVQSVETQTDTLLQQDAEVQTETKQQEASTQTISLPNTLKSLSIDTEEFGRRISELRELYVDTSKREIASEYSGSSSSNSYSFDADDEYEETLPQENVDKLHWINTFTLCKDKAVQQYHFFVEVGNKIRLLNLESLSPIQRSYIPGKMYPLNLAQLIASFETKLSYEQPVMRNYDLALQSQASRSNVAFTTHYARQLAGSLTVFLDSVMANVRRDQAEISCLLVANDLVNKLYVQLIKVGKHVETGLNLLYEKELNDLQSSSQKTPQMKGKL